MDFGTLHDNWKVPEPIIISNNNHTLKVQFGDWKIVSIQGQNLK